MWDLGMKLNYKTALGAREMERAEFVSLFHKLRGRSSRIGSDGKTHGPLDLLQCNEARNCKNIIMD